MALWSFLLINAILISHVPLAVVQTYSGSANIIGDNAIHIDINYETDQIDLYLSGESGVWIGYGFGSSLMAGT